MSKFERIIGNIMATILTMVIILAICLSIFNILFRDARGVGFYGNRGNSYIYDDYQ